MSIAWGKQSSLSAPFPPTSFICTHSISTHSGYIILISMCPGYYICAVFTRAILIRALRVVGRKSSWYTYIVEEKDALFYELTSPRCGVDSINYDPMARHTNIYPFLLRCLSSGGCGKEGFWWVHIAWMVRVVPLSGVYYMCIQNYITSNLTQLITIDLCCFRPIVGAFKCGYNDERRPTGSLPRWLSGPPHVNAANDDVLIDDNAVLVIKPSNP